MDIFRFFKKQLKINYTVWKIDENKALRFLYATCHPVEYYVSSRKSREKNGKPFLVTFDEYRKNKKRDGLKIIAKIQLPFVTINESKTIMTESPARQMLRNIIYFFKRKRSKVKIGSHNGVNVLMFKRDIKKLKHDRSKALETQTPGLQY